jgi:hypothetical protein
MVAQRLPGESIRALGTLRIHKTVELNVMEQARRNCCLNVLIERAAQQLIEPDRPQLAFHQRPFASGRLNGIVGWRVNSGVVPLRIRTEARLNGLEPEVYGES